MDLWAQWGKERVGRIKTEALKPIYTPPRVKQIARGRLLDSTGNSAWRSGMAGVGMGCVGRRLTRQETYVFL